MCVGGGQKSSISVFDRLKQNILNQQNAKNAPTVNGKKVAPAPVIEGVQGNTAASGVLGDRVSGAPASSGAPTPFNLTTMIGTLLKIGTAPKQTDPNAVAAGRIGRSYGASDLRIGG